MPRFGTLYLHNTYKHTDLQELLHFHRSCGYAGIGYHFAINPDGTIFNTRPLEVQGAHVLGKNTETIGLVFLDINKCAASDNARKSFKHLYAELSERAGSKLQMYSHTEGQFEYLNQLIGQFNADLQNPSFTPIGFDLAVCKEEVLAQKKSYILEKIIAQRRMGVPKMKRDSFQKIVHFSDKLKICPGKDYLAFRNEVR